MNSDGQATQLKQFRRQVYQNLNQRADAIMDLLDALSSNTQARSVVELSLEACFRRKHTSVFKTITAYQPAWMSKSLAQLASDYLPAPSQRAFWLFGVDTTPQPRLYAQTLPDRSYVYQPAAIQSNKPVTIGHCYSEVVLLPERAMQQGHAWVVPLSSQRVSSAADKELEAGLQMNVLLDDPQLPFHEQLCVEVGDTSYSKPKYLFANRAKSNLVTLVRVRGTRTFYRQPAPVLNPSGSRGHPAWYGAAFSLQDSSTWPVPNETTTLHLISRRGREYRLEIEAWHNLLMRGKRKPIAIPMQRYPFTLARIRVYLSTGQLAHSQPLWVLVMGEKRDKLSLSDIHIAYNQRFDLEHFFRFGKQRLLLADFQTPDRQPEENWWQFVHLAYLQLWVARSLAENQPRPWERALTRTHPQSLSPTRVQRDFARIIRQIGTPASSPKRRGYSPGRQTGTILTHRPRLPVVFKGFT
jgi:hypothetical protein